MILMVVLLGGCKSEDERYDYGHGDGQAAGYNEICDVRGTLIEGDWSDELYRGGYQLGYTTGGMKCLAEKMDYIIEELEGDK